MMVSNPFLKRIRQRLHLIHHGFSVKFAGRAHEDKHALAIPALTGYEFAAFHGFNCLSKIHSLTI